jgi:PKD repeat protein
MKRYLFISLFCLAVISCKKETEPVPEAVSEFYLGSEVVKESTTITPINVSKDAVSYLWDFGNGETSTQEIPSIYFGKGGTYTVSLTVKNAAGVSTTSQRKIKVLTPMVKKIMIEDLIEWDGSRLTYQTLKRFKGGDVWLEIYKPLNTESYNQLPGTNNGQASGYPDYPLYYRSPVYKNVPANFTGPVVIEVPDAISLTGKNSSDKGYKYTFAVFVQDDKGKHLLFTSDFIGSVTFPQGDELTYDWSCTFMGTQATVTFAFE